MEKKHPQLLLVWVIVLLILSNLISLYFLLQPKSDPAFFSQGGDTPMKRLEKLKPPKFKLPMDDSAGRRSVKAYRENLMMRSYGVFYDVDVIQHYLTNVYPGLTRQMGGNTTDYKWKLGFYWMITKSKDDSNRLSFCVVPTLVSKTDSTKVIDYFNDAQHMYNPPSAENFRDMMRPPGDSGFVYNEGQLWP